MHTYILILTFLHILILCLTIGFLNTKFIMINIGSLNVKGLRDGRKASYASTLIQQHKLDVLFFQETHFLTDDEGRRAFSSRNLSGLCSHGGSHSRGVGILFNKRLDLKINFTKIDSDGRLVVVDTNISGTRLRFVNIYAPNGGVERRSFLTSVGAYLQGNVNLVVGGDFNFIEVPALDKAGGDARLGTVGFRELTKIKDDFLLSDIFRSKFPLKKSFTFNGHNLQARLDRFYINSDLLPSVESFETHPCTFSDHDLISFKLGTRFNGMSGPGFWKCNTSVLENKNLINDMVKLWEFLDSQPTKDLQWWEHCKNCFKNLIITHSKRIAKEKKGEFGRLEKDISLLRVLEAQNPGQYTEKLKTYSDRLSLLLHDKLEGAKIRSKIQHLECDEKPTRFFLRKEITHSKDKLIESLLINDHIVADPELITNECESFYRSLYTQEAVDLEIADTFVAGLPRLSPEDRLGCEGPVTVQECHSAISGMKDGKTPGIDGLPKEFYSKFFYLFGPAFVEVVARSFEEGTLCPSQRSGVITLICKDKNRKTELSCWRPITLLTVDYKIISKVLCNRLSRVMSSLIGEEQACAVPGRSIQDQLHLTRSLFSYVEGRDVPCGILNLDQAKAFDRVSHDYLFLVLRSAGFGPDFLNWIKLLYNNINSRVLVNGYFTNSFPIRRSVRQGCGLSPLLYVLSVEPLTRMICSSPSVRGLHFPGLGGELRVIQYADDTTVVVRDEGSVGNILKICQSFGKASGAKLNTDKSKGMWLNEYRKTLKIVHGISFDRSCIRVLGVTFTRDPEVLGETNWAPILNKFVKVLSDWGSRDLTLRGKAMIAEIFGCSKLWFVGKVLFLDDKFLKKFNNYMFLFIWSGDKDRVKRGVMHQATLLGGQNVVNINLKLEAFRILLLIKLIIEEGTHRWRSLAIYFVGFHLRKWKPAFAANTIPHAAVIPPFYARALKDFKAFTDNFPLIKLDSLNSLKIYNLLLSKKLTTPSICLKQENLLINFNTVWSNASSSFLCPGLRDFCWRVAHGVLPLNDKLHRQDKATTDKCPLCRTDVENPLHLFLLCSVVVPVLAVVQRLVDGVTGRLMLLDRDKIIFGLFPSCPVARLPAVLLITALYKRSVWQVRNRIKKEKQKLNSKDIFFLFKSQLKLRFITDGSRFKPDIFKGYWGFNKEICLLKDDKWVFTFNDVQL